MLFLGREAGPGVGLGWWGGGQGGKGWWGVAAWASGLVGGPGWAGLAGDQEDSTVGGSATSMGAGACAACAGPASCWQSRASVRQCVYERACGQAVWVSRGPAAAGQVTSHAMPAAEPAEPAACHRRAPAGGVAGAG